MALTIEDNGFEIFTSGNCPVPVVMGCSSDGKVRFREIDFTNKDNVWVCAWIECDTGNGWEESCAKIQKEICDGVNNNEVTINFSGSIFFTEGIDTKFNINRAQKCIHNSVKCRIQYQEIYQDLTTDDCSTTETAVQTAIEFDVFNVAQQPDNLILPYNYCGVAGSPKHFMTVMPRWPEGELQLCNPSCLLVSVWRGGGPAFNFVEIIVDGVTAQIRPLLTTVGNAVGCADLVPFMEGAANALGIDVSEIDCIIMHNANPTSGNPTDQIKIRFGCCERQEFYFVSTSGNVDTIQSHPIKSITHAQKGEIACFATACANIIEGGDFTLYNKNELTFTVLFDKKTDHNYLCEFLNSNKKWAIINGKQYAINSIDGDTQIYKSFKGKNITYSFQLNHQKRNQLGY